jgi:hypothetical protein
LRRLAATPAVGQLAHRLQALGIGPEVPVGVCMERSLEIVVALLGTLKSGGVFVPLDPAAPAARLAGLIEGSQAAVVLTQQRFLQSLLPCDARVLCLEAGWETMNQQPETRPECAATSENLAYVIYTSGSTGGPKGAMNTHAGICNRLMWMQAQFRLGAEDRVLQAHLRIGGFFWPPGRRPVVVAGPVPGRGQLTETIVGTASRRCISCIDGPTVRVGSGRRALCLAAAGDLRGEAPRSAERCLPFARPAAQPVRATEAAIEHPVGMPAWQQWSRLHQAADRQCTVYLDDICSRYRWATVSHIGGVALREAAWASISLQLLQPLSDQPGSRLYRTGDGRFPPGTEFWTAGRPVKIVACNQA